MITEFSLFLFTTLGGIAAGAYCANALFYKAPASGKRPLLPLIAIILLAISGIALLLHLGRPERVLGAFSNLRAGIAQEGVTMIAFGICVAADLVLSWFMSKRTKAVVTAAGVTGALTMTAMGAAYFYCVGVEVWNTPVTIFMFVSTALAVGALLFALFEKDAFENKVFSSIACVLIVIAAIGVAAQGIVLYDGGFSMTPFMIAAVLLAIDAVLPSIDAVRKAAWGPAVLFAVAAIALIVSRYAFYSVV